MCPYFVSRMWGKVIILYIKFFENMAKFKYFRMKITVQNCIHKQIKIKLNGKCFLPCGSELSPSFLPFKNSKMKYTEI
jgi:hypothetical protein